MRQNSLERNKTHLEGINIQKKKTKQTKPNKNQKQQQKEPNNKAQTVKDTSCLNIIFHKLRKRAEMIVLCVSHRHRQRQCHLQPHWKSKSSRGGSSTLCFSLLRKIHTTELLSTSEDIQADSAASLLPPLKQFLKALDRLAFRRTRYVNSINLLQ